MKQPNRKLVVSAVDRHVGQKHNGSGKATSIVTEKRGFGSKDKEATIALGKAKGPKTRDPSSPAKQTTKAHKSLSRGISLVRRRSKSMSPDERGRRQVRSMSPPIRHRSSSPLPTSSRKTKKYAFDVEDDGRDEFPMRKEPGLESSRRIDQLQVYNKRARSPSHSRSRSMPPMPKETGAMSVLKDIAVDMIVDFERCMIGLGVGPLIIPDRPKKRKGLRVYQSPAVARTTGNQLRPSPSPEGDKNETVVSCESEVTESDDSVEPSECNDKADFASRKARIASVENVMGAHKARDRESKPQPLRYRVKPLLPPELLQSSVDEPSEFQPEPLQPLRSLLQRIKPPPKKINVKERMEKQFPTFKRKPKKTKPELDRKVARMTVESKQAGRANTTTQVGPKRDGPAGTKPENSSQPEEKRDATPSLQDEEGSFDEAVWEEDDVVDVELEEDVAFEDEENKGQNATSVMPKGASLATPVAKSRRPAHNTASGVAHQHATRQAVLVSRTGQQDPPSAACRKTVQGDRVQSAFKQAFLHPDPNPNVKRSYSLAESALRLLGADEKGPLFLSPSTRKETPLSDYCAHDKRDDETERNTITMEQIRGLTPSAPTTVQQPVASSNKDVPWLLLVVDYALCHQFNLVRRPPSVTNEEEGGFFFNLLGSNNEDEDMNDGVRTSNNGKLLTAHGAKDEKGSVLEDSDEFDRREPSQAPRGGAVFRQEETEPPNLINDDNATEKSVAETLEGSREKRDQPPATAFLKQTFSFLSLSYHPPALQQQQQPVSPSNDAASPVSPTNTAASDLLSVPTSPTASTTKPQPILRSKGPLNSTGTLFPPPEPPKPAQSSSGPRNFMATPFVRKPNFLLAPLSPKKTVSVDLANQISPPTSPPSRLDVMWSTSEQEEDRKPNNNKVRFHPDLANQISPPTSPPSRLDVMWSTSEQEEDRKPNNNKVRFHPEVMQIPVLPVGDDSDEKSGSQPVARSKKPQRKALTYFTASLKSFVGDRYSGEITTRKGRNISGPTQPATRTPVSFVRSSAPPPRTALDMPILLSVDDE